MVTHIRMNAFYRAKITINNSAKRIEAAVCNGLDVGRQMSVISYVG